MSSILSDPIAAAFKAQHLNWSTIPVEHPAEGIERQMIVGQNLMLCRFRFTPFLVTPQHRHPHEQISLVMQGRVRFFVEGAERIVSPGDALQFPANCLHGATMMDEEVVLIDIFTPIREDFVTNLSGSPETGQRLRRSITTPCDGTVAENSDSDHATS